MKKIDGSLSAEYLPLVIYKDEIEDIVLELGSGRSVTIESDGFEYDSVDELVENSRMETPKCLQIKCTNPYTCIDLKPYMSELYIGSSDRASSGLYHKLDSILKDCQRACSWFYSFVFITLLNLLIVSVSSLSRIHPTIKVVVQMAFFSWLGWVLYVRIRKHSTILLFSHKDKKTFWARNKDQIIVAVISALLGAILGVFVTIGAQHFKLG